VAGVTGKLTGVGVGPGDPELLTRRALRILGEADRVVAPTTSPDEPGRAETVVLEALPGLAVTRLPFDMSLRDVPRLDAARPLVPWLDAGEHVAFVTLGDPNVYSTFGAVARALEVLGCPVDVATVPGIMAFQELAARSGTVLVDGIEGLSLVTALDGVGHVAEALEDPTRAVIVYKGGRHVPAIARLLADRGRLDGAVVGELLGLPGERIAAVDPSAAAASYLVAVIVPPAGRRG
jgi:precorrin-2/cobalt-factor-2 C20-methyltransferase